MIAAVDPGTGKFVCVICDDSGDLLLSGVSSIADLEIWAGKVFAGEIAALEPMAVENCGKIPLEEPPAFVLVGSGTGSRSVIDRLRASGLSVKLISEQYSTIRGRDLFWKIHPPKGFWRLFPRSLLVPHRSVDDLAAWSMVMDFISDGCEPGVGPVGSG